MYLLCFIDFFAWKNRTSPYNFEGILVSIKFFTELCDAVNYSGIY